MELVEELEDDTHHDGFDVDRGSGAAHMLKMSLPRGRLLSCNGVFLVEEEWMFAWG